jgi:hypothetical protein
MVQIHPSLLFHFFPGVPPSMPCMRLPVKPAERTNGSLPMDLDGGDSVPTTSVRVPPRKSELSLNH